MATTLLYNAEIANEGRRFRGYVLVDGQKIGRVGEGTADGAECMRLKQTADRAVDCGGRLLIPGVIDTHVHFRDPGLTEKGDMATESRAAVAGGVTSVVDMPNTKPATVTCAALGDKIRRAAEVSAANFGFYRRHK